MKWGIFHQKCHLLFIYCFALIPSLHLNNRRVIQASQLWIALIKLILISLHMMASPVKRVVNVVHQYCLHSMSPFTIPFSIFESLQDKLQIPSIDRVSSILVKLLGLKKIKLFQSLLFQIGKLAQENSYAGRIVLLYYATLLVIPLKKYYKIGSEGEGQQNKAVMNIALRKYNGESFIALEIQHSSELSDQQAGCLIFGRLEVEIQKYDIQLVWEDRKQMKIRYSSPIIQAGIRYPHILLIHPGRMELVYQSSDGIQLKDYLLLASSFKSKQEAYSIQTIIDHLALTLEQTLRSQHQRFKYFQRLSLQNIFISRKEEILINASPKQINFWKIDKNQEQNKKSISCNPLKYLFSGSKTADFRSIGIILLQSIAISYNITLFQQSGSSLDQDSKEDSLRQFICFIKEENIIVNEGLLQKIEKWLFLKVQQQDQPYQGQLYSFANIEEYIQKIQTTILANVKKVGPIMAITLTENQIIKLEQNILKDSHLFSLLGLREIVNTVQFSLECSICLQGNRSYINDCGHAICLNCFTILVNKFTCNEEYHLLQCFLCDNDISLQVIKKYLASNKKQRGQFCNKFFVFHSQLNQDYNYCEKESYTNGKKVKLYHRRQSKIFICQYCNVAFCSKCRNQFHWPLQCQQFLKNRKKLKEEVQNVFALREWNSKVRKLKIKEHTLVAEAQTVIREWVILYECQKIKNSLAPNNKMMRLSLTLFQLIQQLSLLAARSVKEPQECWQLRERISKIITARQSILVYFFV